jgi:ABC-type nitrate/sulfonate/bicarbonate transport system substrate-binding protein
MGPRHISRRRVVKRAASALALAALPRQFISSSASAAEALEEKSIEIAAVRDPQLGAQIAIANQYGYFKDEGLDATVHWNQSGADVITEMAGGSQYIGTHGVFGAVVFGGQDLPIKIITALADIAGTQGFVLSPGVKLANPRELEGKKLAFTEGNSQVLILAKMAKMFNIDTTKITMVNMNPAEGVVAASKSDVQGLLGWQPNLYRLTQLGGTLYATGTTLYVSGRPEPLPMSDQLQYNHSVLMAAKSWIDGKPNTLRAVLRAVRTATALLASDRPKALAAMQQQLRIDPDALTVMADANKYAMDITDAVAASLKFQSDWALEIKRIPKPVTPEEVFAPQLLREIDPHLVTWTPRT